MSAHAILLNQGAADAGGENVYCSEVEAVLSGHPQVLQAAVFGMPNSVMGEMVHAAIVLRNPPSTPVTPQHIVTWCQSQLALYKCPTAVHIVKELPTTGSGKVLKNVLRATFTRGSGLAAAGTAVALPASAAAAVPASTCPLMAVAAAAAEAAVSAVAPGVERSASEAHAHFRRTSADENGKDAYAGMLNAIIAYCPGARILDLHTDDYLVDPSECYMMVVGDWTRAVTQVMPCAQCIAKQPVFTLLTLLEVQSVTALSNASTS